MSLNVSEWSLVARGSSTQLAATGGTTYRA